VGWCGGIAVGRRIFIVDDDCDMLHLMAKAVRRHAGARDADILLATSGHTGLQLLREHGRPGDVAVLDYVLGDLTGVELRRLAPDGVACHVFSSLPRALVGDVDGVLDKDEFDDHLDLILGVTPRP
jgi:hypothetical protein